jgi:hypothetical protein
MTGPELTGIAVSIFALGFFIGVLAGAIGKRF